jgi:hypothetical protein
MLRGIHYRIFIFLIFLFLSKSIIAQHSGDTLKYKWEGRNHSTIPSYQITIMTFYPDSTFKRECFNQYYKEQEFDSIVPKIDKGRWCSKHKIIIINCDKEEGNGSIMKYKLRRKSIKYIPNNYLPPHRRSRLGYLWVYWTRAMKLKLIE